MTDQGERARPVTSEKGRRFELSIPNRQPPGSLRWAMCDGTQTGHQLALKLKLSTNGPYHAA